MHFMLRQSVRAITRTIKFTKWMEGGETEPTKGLLLLHACCEYFIQSWNFEVCCLHLFKTSKSNNGREERRRDSYTRACRHRCLQNNTHTVLSYKSFENRVDRLFEFPLRLFTSWQFNLPNYSFSSAMRLSGLKKRGCGLWSERRSLLE